MDVVKIIIDLLISQRANVLFELKFPTYYMLTSSFEKIADEKVFEFITFLKYHYRSLGFFEITYLRYAELQAGREFPKVNLLVNIDIEIVSELEPKCYLNDIWKNCLDIYITSFAEYYLDSFLRIEKISPYEVQDFVRKMFLNNKFVGGPLKPKASPLIGKFTGFDKFFERRF